MGFRTVRGEKELSGRNLYSSLLTIKVLLSQIINHPTTTVQKPISGRNFHACPGATRQGMRAAATALDALNSFINRNRHESDEGRRERPSLKMHFMGRPIFM